MNILRVKRRSVELIERIERGGAYVHLALQQEADRYPGAPEEYPVITQLVRGVLEQRGVLEEMLTPLLPKGFESLPDRVQTVLKLGAYQISFLDRVKKRDVVFEAVELVKDSKWRGFAGLINAVLRKVEPMSEVERGDNAVINFPEWLVLRWMEQFGEVEVREFCAACDKPLPLYLRVNTEKVSPDLLRDLLQNEGVGCQRSQWSEGSLRVTNLPEKRRLAELECYQKGFFFIQDASSSVVGDIASRDVPARVWDVCAAPGGKSCAIALSIFSSNGVVVASDRVQGRVGLIQDLVKRLQISNIETRVYDALEGSADLDAAYDLVLVDAPCSGFGTAGRKVDGRWSKSREVLEELVTIQSRLLDRVANSVTAGGALVYSTCTIDRAENEDVIKCFLERRSDFSVDRLERMLPQDLCTPEGFYRAWPHKHAMAGAFAARLIRTR